MRIEQLTNKDLAYFAAALKEIKQNFSLEQGYLFKYIIEDITGLIYLNFATNLVSFYYYDQNLTLKNIMGYFNSEYNFEYFYCHNLTLFKEENVWLLINDKGILQTINFFPMTNNSSFNGQVIFAQHNPFNNMLISMYYNHMYQNEKSKISAFALHNPWKIIIARTKFPKYEKHYIAQDINCYQDSFKYATLVLRKYGFKQYKNNHLPDTLTNYYRIFFPFNKDTGFNLFPLTSILDKKEITNKIKLYGFDDQVNSYLLNAYNGNFTLLNDYQELLLLLQTDLKLVPNKGLKLVLKNE